MAAPERRATIKDVAKRAGVTGMTVSRAVNGSGSVSSEARERIRAAIEELGYVPNRLARGLRSSRTHTIALVVTDVTNPFFTTIARGVEDAASDRDNLVLLCNTDESEDEEMRYLEMLASQSVDGVLLVPAKTGVAAREFARRRNLPIVVLDRRLPALDVNAVRCESRTASADMARYLRRLGHARVAILAGPVGVPTSDDRVEGFRAAAEHLDVAVHHGRFSTESGQEMARLAMRASPRPTALFTLSNFIAIGALKELKAMGARVPEDVSVVSFDDLPASMVADPFLTVVSQPAYEMGHRAVDLLLDGLADPSGQPQEIVLPTEMIVRESSAPPARP